MLFGFFDSLKHFAKAVATPVLRTFALSLVIVIALTFAYHSIAFALDSAGRVFLPLLVANILYLAVWVRARDRFARPGKVVAARR